jgi:hypothetical protein
VSHERPVSLRFARTRAGLELPVLDVTDPLFAVSDAELERAGREFQRPMLGWLPARLRGAIMRRLLRGSMLGEAVGRSRGSFLVVVQVQHVDAGRPLVALHQQRVEAVNGWRDTAALAGVVAEAPVTVVSSEGALFEYGSDEEIAANLRALRGVPRVVGSVTRAGPLTDRLLAGGGVAIRPRALDAFARLAGGAGWDLERSIDRPFSHQVSLRPR